MSALRSFPLWAAVAAVFMLSGCNTCNMSVEPAEKAPAEKAPAKTDPAKTDPAATKTTTTVTKTVTDSTTNSTTTKNTTTTTTPPVTTHVVPPAASASGSATVPTDQCPIAIQPEGPAQQMLPLIRLIPASHGMSDYKKPMAKYPDEGWEKAEVCNLIQPAHFPRYQYKLNGAAFRTEGAMIYEGLSLKINKETGEYAVRFLIQTPDVPVTVHLQLQCKLDFAQRANVTNRPKSPPNRVATLHLPPLRFPYHKHSDYGGGNMSEVYYLGLLPGYRGIANDKDNDNQECSPKLSPLSIVAVTGTARFGYGVNVEQR